MSLWEANMVTALALCGAFIMGSLAAFQSPTNASLSRCIGNLEASCISFAGGVILLSLLVLFIGTGSFEAARGLPWWCFLGGFYGATLVTVITFAADILGIALLMVAIMVGQSIAALTIDSMGWFLVTPQPVVPLRILGVALVLAGLVLIYQGKKALFKEKSPNTSTDKSVSGKSLVAVFIAILAGVGGAIQVPTNAALASNIGQLEAALVNFCVGFTILCILTLLLRSKKRGRDFKSTKPWQYTGGAYGAMGVFLSLTVMPILGVALMSACQLLGQLGGGMLIDAKGLLLSPRMPMNRLKWLGLIVIVLGILALTFARL